MPGPLIDSAPFRRKVDANLVRLVTTLRAALDPDAVELEFHVLPDGRLYRRRFLGEQGGAARLVRKVAVAAPNDGILRASFESPGLLRGTLGLVRRARRPWTGAERMRFELLRPFVTQLLERSARSEADCGARRRLLAAAESARGPILVLDGCGTILFANEAADALLSNQIEEGLAVLADDGRATPLLCHLLKSAWAEPPVASERLALTNGRFLEARVTRVPDDEGDDVTGARVITLHERAALTIEDVRPQLHARGISGRETDVVAAVLQGMRNSEIAERLFISEYTVKDHLKHVFHKLGVAGRGGLLRALYSSPGTDTPTAP